MNLFNIKYKYNEISINNIDITYVDILTNINTKTFI